MWFFCEKTVVLLWENNDLLPDTLRDRFEQRINHGVTNGKDSDALVAKTIASPYIYAKQLEVTLKELLLKANL